MSHTATIPSETKIPPKQEVRYLNTDNSWNRDGLLAAFDELKDKMVYCSASNKPLYYVREDGTKVLLETFGVCADTGNPYHYSELKIPEGVDVTSYPVEYIGYVSKEASSKDLTSEELMQIREEYGVWS